MVDTHRRPTWTARPRVRRGRGRATPGGDVAPGGLDHEGGGQRARELPSRRDDKS